MMTFGLGCMSVRGLQATVTLIATLAGTAYAGDWPDIRSVDPDLTAPLMTDASPQAGFRVRATLPGWDSETVYHVLSLPADWQKDQRYPVIVEYPGNGGYRNSFGDECTGRPEDCCLGWGLAEGRNFLWICLPFLNGAGDKIALNWWGDAPDYNPQPTLRYCRAAVADVCLRYGGDSSRVVLCGFSRGAIACSYVGLHDAETAKLWKAFIPCSHYDGVRRWPYADGDAESAALRFGRLNARPQFVCGEADQVEETRQFLTPIPGESQLIFASTGFRNHSDRWILRPSPARTRLREWLHNVVRKDP